MAWKRFDDGHSSANKIWKKYLWAYFELISVLPASGNFHWTKVKKKKYKRNVWSRNWKLLSLFLHGIFTEEKKCWCHNLFVNKLKFELLANNWFSENRRLKRKQENKIRNQVFCCVFFIFNKTNPKNRRARRKSLVLLTIYNTMRKKLMERHRHHIVIGRPPNNNLSSQ